MLYCIMYHIANRKRVLVADKWCQHKWGRCKSKGAPWYFWENKSRLTGVPKKFLCQKNTNFAVTPISADPIRPFPIPSLEARATLNPKP